MRGGHIVEQKGFSIDQRNQDQGLHQKLLDRVKCLLGLRRLFEVVGLLQKLIKGEASFVEARDEVAEHGEAPYNSLHPLHILNRSHPHDG